MLDEKLLDILTNMNEKISDVSSRVHSLETKIDTLTADSQGIWRGSTSLDNRIQNVETLCDGLSKDIQEMETKQKTNHDRLYTILSGVAVAVIVIIIEGFVLGGGMPNNAENPEPSGLYYVIDEEVLHN